MRPSRITAIVSAIDIASSWSCVTCTNVMPTSRWMWLSSSCSCLRRRRSSAPSGSSSSSARGRLTSARASATRCCWPPDICAGLRRANGRELDELERLGDAPLDLVLGDLLALQPERDVLLDRHVREQRVALEDRVDVALVRRHVRDVDAAELDRALGRLLEAADHPQRRRLAAARGPEQREEAAARDVQVERVDGDLLAEALGHAAQRDVGAAGSPAFSSDTCAVLSSSIAPLRVQEQEP